MRTKKLKRKINDYQFEGNFNFIIYNCHSFWYLVYVPLPILLVIQYKKNFLKKK